LGATFYPDTVHIYKFVFFRRVKSFAYLLT